MGGLVATPATPTQLRKSFWEKTQVPIELYPVLLDDPRIVTALNEATLKEALKAVKYPGFSRDIVSFGLVESATVDNGTVKVGIAVTTASPTVPKQIRDEAEACLKALEGVGEVEVSVKVSAPSGQQGSGGQARQQDAGPVPMQKVRYKIAVASGKGGVGKSTFAANLACAIDRILRGGGHQRAVGVMDCDIYGPSIPLMLGIHDQPVVEDNLIQPLENFDIRVMSMGLLIDEETPVVWRGPMINKTIQQFAGNVNWGELEVLVVDLPPGTGDPQLSLVQTIPLDGAIVVTTPQDAAVNVARRGALMFEKVNVPLLGVAENMSYLENADGSRSQIFGQGGGQATAKALETELIGQVPLDERIRIGSDGGTPVVISHPDSPAARVFEQMATALLEKLARAKPR
jgi:ATP-binding protein involved in chromosome partitioning